ncbi:acyl-CoA synthetases/AMP-acid ligases II [Mollisia scopiformis]|uniref:Acyl-CoA synthetases/AMP-acid ligases II n=1 Tax=Mollisia scopiformis TaxID=149040 RepID=A0A194X655_MOLSC|nr:acyl-CoA synthetases/AMP-acid ligases II [Mollisia scopiformis]KUJ15292.1 acyl-CoA synthetases/AMP-acid ligases II [Mollisia scopiformis]
MKIYTSPYPAPTLPTHLTLPQFLAIDNPDSVPDDKVILEDDWTGNSLTYGGLRDRASEHAWTWRTWAFEGGFELDDGVTVGIAGVNSVHLVSAIYSVLWAGGVVSLMSPQSTIADFKHALGIVKPRYMIVDANIVGKVAAALGDATTDIIVLGESPVGHNSSLAHYPKHFSTTSRLEPQPLPKGKTAKDVTAIIPFSSGTSGLPKAVQLSHYALIAILKCSRASDPEMCGREDRSVFFAPLGHIYGFNTVLTSVWRGAYFILMRAFDLERFLRLSEEKKVTILGIVPVIANLMARRGVLDRYDLGGVRVVLCAAAVLEDEVVRRLRERLGGAPIVQGYGMTEGLVSVQRRSEAGKVGSVGRLFAGVEARIVDDNMNDVPPGQAGELLVKGPLVFNGYINNPTATNDAFHNGWLKTGDVVRIDNEGFLYIFDRKKEIIKYQGFQVSPTELEAILSTHPFVLDAAVCAKWDKGQGTEVPLAYIVLSQKGKEMGIEKACEEVRAWFDGRIAGYKRLRGGVESIDVVPRTALGKVMRWGLPARVEMVRERERERKVVGRARL